MHLARRAATLLVGTLFSVPAFAQERDSASRDTGVIVVTGQRLGTVSDAGTKSSVPLAETPQSISVIDASDIAGLGIANLNQALRFVAGVTPEQRGSSAEVYDQFKLRGFDALQYLDGLRTFNSPSGYAASQVDMSRLERIEVVKGPASALYGQSGPGGLVALSSKLPIDAAYYGAVSATYGTFDLYRLDADVGGKISDTIGVRVYGSANGAHTQQTFGKRERQTISGAVTLGMGTATTLTLLGNYSHDPENGTYGLFPAVGTFFANPNGQLSTRFDAGEPGNRFQRDQAGGTYILRHEFSSDWSLRASGRYEAVQSTLGLIYAAGTLDPADPTQRTYLRASYATDEDMKAWTFDNQLVGRVATGPITHRLLFGFDSQVLHSTESASFGSFGSINAWNPVYGTQPVPMTPAQVPDGFVSQSDYNVRQRGVYAQDEMSWGGLRVTLSGRQDWTRIEPIGSAAETANKFTWRAGALYKTAFGLAPYVSYGTSFQPQTGNIVDATGATIGQAVPSLGKQLEIGAKYQLPGTPILVTAAWFDIDQTNVLTYLANLGGFQQTGKVNSTGVEVEATAPLPLGFEARLAFSRQGVKDGDGKRVMGVGRGGTSFNLEWAPKRGVLEGLAIGGAVRHVDQVFAGTYFDGTSANTPSYTLVDGLIRYELGKAVPALQGVSLSVNAANLFDKKYLSACYLDYGWCWYGNRRTVQGTIGFRW